MDLQYITRVKFHPTKSFFFESTHHKYVFRKEYDPSENLLPLSSVLLSSYGSRIDLFGSLPAATNSIDSFQIQHEPVDRQGRIFGLFFILVTV